jgi:flagellar assembly protein FliH
MSTGVAVPFLFNHDFGSGSRRSEADARASADAVAAAFARGEEAGRARTMESETARLAAAVSAVGARLAAIEKEAVQRALAQERTVTEVALAIGRKLAGAALARFPLAEIEHLAAQCFAEAREAPHVAVRVNDALVEAVDIRLRAAAGQAGFAGRLIVLGDPDMALGDARLEWADGGILHDGATLAQRIGEVLAGHLAACDASGKDRP